MAVSLVVPPPERVRVLCLDPLRKSVGCSVVPAHSVPLPVRSAIGDYEVATTLIVRHGHKRDGSPLASGKASQ